MKRHLKSCLSFIIQSKYLKFRSFSVKTCIIFILMGIIPFLLATYLFLRVNIMLTDVVIIFGSMALFSILLGFYLLRNSAKKIAELVQKTEIVKDWENSETIKIKADEELTSIANNFNSLLKDLKEQGVQLMCYAKDLTEAFEINQKEVELRTTLSRYVRADLVDKLIQADQNLLFENERKEVTILFADIRSFTTITERMNAEEVVSMLNQFFGIMVDIIFKNNGVLDKYIGDNLMALFGFIPTDTPAPFHAIKAAIEMQEATEALMKERKKENKEIFKIGIGINTGIAIAGNVGSEHRSDYTVIGDCVNVAARLEQMAKGGEIIIGEDSYRLVKDLFQMEEKGEINARNKKELILCYNVLKRKPKLAINQVNS